MHVKTCLCYFKFYHLLAPFNVLKTITFWNNWQKQTFQLLAGFRVPRPFAIHPVSSRRVRLLVVVSRVDLLWRGFIFSLDFQKSPHDFVARGRPLCGQKRLAPLAKRSTCSKSIFYVYLFMFFFFALSKRARRTRHAKVQFSLALTQSVDCKKSVLL